MYKSITTLIILSVFLFYIHEPSINSNEDNTTDKSIFKNRVQYDRSFF